MDRRAVLVDTLGCPGVTFAPSAPAAALTLEPGEKPGASSPLPGPNTYTHKHTITHTHNTAANRFR
jgi:hypothetical protein